MKAYWEGDYVCFLRDDEMPHEYMRELTQTELDAERFRWLMKQHASEGRSVHVRSACNDVLPADLGAAIDEAMVSN